MMPKVLFVDDDPAVLQAFRRQFRKSFQIETAPNGTEALETIDNRGPFAVIVSDMRMPGMNGVEFLKLAREWAPQTVRIMLTGNADQQTAINAVNEGSIFRFLCKPCPPEQMLAAIQAGIRQYELVTAEKELLEKTLSGSVKVLTDVLALTNPLAFGHASRVHRLVKDLCAQIKPEPAWHTLIAAMLSQIGCVTVPQRTLEKVYRGQRLTSEERDMLDAHPATGSDLVANIPRLEPVARIIAYQRKGFDGSGTPTDGVAGDRIPLGARILRVALDYDTLRTAGREEVDAFVELRAHATRYDPRVLAALENTIGFEETLEVREVPVEQLDEGMTLARDLITSTGALLVSKGQEVTCALRRRLCNFARHGQIRDRVWVLVEKRVVRGEQAALPPEKTGTPR